jgi:hypothetical protein
MISRRLRGTCIAGIAVGSLAAAVPSIGQTSLGRNAAAEAIDHLLGRCEYKTSCIKAFGYGLTPRSTADSVRKSKPKAGTAYEICEIGYGTGRKDGLIACVNYLRGW